MKVSKKHIAVLEWCLAVILIMVCFNQFKVYYGYFSPKKAIRAEEKRFHYGPSEIVKTMDFKGNKIYFLRYKEWYSVDIVEKRGLKWYTFGVSGNKIENENKPQIDYRGGELILGNDDHYVNLNGYVTDLNIEKLVFESENKENSLALDVDETRMFMFIYDFDWDKSKEGMLKILKGFDKSGNLIYEREIFTWD
ncbi:MAG: hypothetical protein RR844_03355 [Clostridium sp.]